MLHQGLSRRDALAQAEKLLELVQISDPARRVREYPYQLSGGMRQRAMIAMALACQPKVLIADEPTTALDAVVQRDVLELMVDLTREHHTAVLMISHDLPMVARYTERMVVMQHGKVLETGTTAGILERPQHPYTVSYTHLTLPTNREV